MWFHVVSELNIIQAHNEFTTVRKRLLKYDFQFWSLFFSCYLRVPQGLSIKLNFTSFDTQQYADNLNIFEGIGQNKILRGKVIFQLILLFH